MAQVDWNFHHQGPGNNLPVDELLVFQHSQTTASWTVLAMVVFTAALAAATAGAVAGARFAAAGGGLRWLSGNGLPQRRDPYQGLPGTPAR